MQNKLKTFSFNFTLLFSAFITLARSPDLWANEDQALLSKVEAVAFIPTAVWASNLKTQLQGSKIPLSQQLDQYQYANADSSIHFVSDRVTFETQFDANLISQTDTSNIDLNLHLDVAHIRGTNFNLTAAIKKDLGFGTATLKLEMHCDLVELKLKNANPVSARVQIDKGGFSLTQLIWDLKNSQIETLLSGCKQVAGFDQLLKSQIQQLIEQSFVVDSLQQIINLRINDLVKEKINSSLALYAKQFKLGAGQIYSFDDKNNLWVYSGKNPEKNFLIEDIQKVKESPKAVLLITKQNLENFAKESLNDSLKSQLLTSRNISGLRKLTCSRLIQTFAWPALKSLSKCFDMQIITQVQELKIADLKSLGLNLKVGAWASGEGQQLAYFESLLRVSVIRGEAELNSFKGQANSDFINWSGRSKRISSKLIQPTLESLLKTTIAKLKENQTLKMIQQGAGLRELSPQTILIEFN